MTPDAFHVGLAAIGGVTCTLVLGGFLRRRRRARHMVKAMLAPLEAVGELQRTIWPDEERI